MIVFEGFEMNRVAFFVCCLLWLFSEHVMGVIDSKGVKISSVPTVYISATGRYFDVTVVNETNGEILISPNLRNFREINLLIKKLNGKEVSLKKFADLEADLNNFNRLSPNSYVGVRINYDSLAEYIDIGEGCYTAKVLYTYIAKNSVGKYFLSVESEEISFCLIKDSFGLKLSD